MLLKISKLAKSTYYYHINQLETDKNRVEKEIIKEIFELNKSRYGYRRITIAWRQQGYIVNHKKVLRLMKLLGLKGKQRKNKYKGTAAFCKNNRL